jgi:4,5-DOPA dioxygenase extradiol
MNEAAERPEASSPSRRMPVVFAGHGSPMNVIEDNTWSRGFAALRELVPKPKAILAVSAHWFIEGTFLTSSPRPKTIHDFSGFPKELYEIEYPAAGSVDLAGRVRGLLGVEQAGLSTEWGLDHGTWSVLRWMYPDADIPVIQLSIDRRLAPDRHLTLARTLGPLRDEGVLILGSGNVTHNLRDAFGRMRSGSTETPDWARRFDREVEGVLEARDGARLIELAPNTDDGRMAHPTPDHWLPLIYAFGAADPRDALRFPTQGFDLGSISMRNVVWG